MIETIEAFYLVVGILAGMFTGEELKLMMRRSDDLAALRRRHEVRS